MIPTSRLAALLSTLALLTSLAACDKMNTPTTNTSTPMPASAASR
ncbi:hypothetical protein [Rhizobacter sp. Root404]|jgi:hypothetical protein|nr:hypothetical protein [Rhizobacter sp. Root404]